MFHDVVMESLIEDHRDGWVLLTLSRPEVKNALNTGVLAALAARLSALANEPTCRAVVLSGAGGHFAAGADIAEIETKTAAEGAVDPRKAHWAAIRGFPKPMIAAVDGFALGGGLELALMADLMVLGDTARLGLPETNLGLIPGAGGGQRLLARLGPARAARLVLLAEIIDADTAMDWGLCSHRAPEALPLAETLATTLAVRAPLAMQAAKAALLEGAEAGLALGAERQGFEALLDTADKAEGIAAFRARRSARFTGQ